MKQTGTSAWPRFLANGLWGFLLLLVFGFLQSWNAANILTSDGVVLVDADGYSRMTRVQWIAENPWRGKIAEHSFENFPIGTRPHTTAPMDYLIVALAAGGNLDLAGAYVSPLLGALTLGVLWILAVRLRLPYRHALTFLFATSPILIHGFALGRPDHQSLVLFLVTLGLLAEIGLTRSEKWGVAWGIIWGLALWVSLFDPLILLLTIWVIRGGLPTLPSPKSSIISRFSLPRSQWLPLLLVLALAAMIDGIRLGGVEASHAAALHRWAQTLGELQGANIALIVSWVGWSAALIPLGLIVAGRRGNSVAWRMLILLFVVTILTCFHLRWGYFFAVVFCLSLPFALGWIPSRAWVYPLFFISLWPVAQLWDGRFFSTETETLRRTETVSDFRAMRRITRELAARPSGGGVLAPWWLSPQIAYQSGQPCVAGSSHQSIDGIVATAEFFLSEDADRAREILTQRQVRYVIMDDADRLKVNSAQILARAPAGLTAADQLTEDDQTFLPELQLLLVSGPFRLYEWTPALMPAAEIK